MSSMLPCYGNQTRKNMEITFDFNTLLEEVKRSLSVIGKRTVDDNGNKLFSDITVSSNEESIISDYFRQAVIDLAAELAAHITTPAKAEGTTIAIGLPSNHDTAIEPFIRDACKAYCVSYALYSWFTVTAPRISEKYNADCSRQVNSVIRLVNQKSEPDAPVSSYADISGTVTPNN